MPNGNVPLIVVMPAYNEEGCIEKVCRAWTAEARRRGGRLVVVDDGSRDATGAILDRLASEDPDLVVVHQANQGHGAALVNAYERALSIGCEWVFHVDSDDQFDPADLERLWSLRESSDLILGHRRSRHDATHRLLLTRVLRFLNLAVFGVHVADANIPFRLIRAEYLRDLLGRMPKGVFAPNVFLSVMAARDGVDLCNVPVTHLARTTGKVSILRWRLVRACLRSAGELISFRLSAASRPHRHADA